MSKDIKEVKQINPEVLALSEKLQGSIKVGKDGAVEVSGKPYIEQLPSTLTKEIVEAVTDYNTTFVAASGHAFGKVAEKAMKAHKGIDSVEANFSMVRKDMATHSYDRQVTSKNAFAKEGESDTVTNFGVLSTTLTIRAGKNKGQLAAVRMALKASAMESFGK